MMTKAGRREYEDWRGRCFRPTSDHAHDDCCARLGCIDIHRYGTEQSTRSLTTERTKAHRREAMLAKWDPTRKRRPG